MLFKSLCQLLLTSYCFIYCFSSQANDTPLRIAVAANFSPALSKLLPIFTKETGINTQVISGSSGSLYLQILHGAPFDVFISADTIRPKELAVQKKIIVNSRQTYAFGQLALWSAIDKNYSLKKLTTTPQRLAIANPETAPYGKAAKQVLEHLQLWSQYQTKLITGNNINQTFEQIRSQAVAAGIIANSQLKLNQLQGIIIPSHYYSPIEQQLVIIKTTKQYTKANEFCQFLLSSTIQAQLTELGYHKANFQPTLALEKQTN